MLALCDSSVLIAAVVPEHSHHESSKAFFSKIVSKKIKGFIALHTVAEYFSVLTRMPLESPVDPELARRLIRENLVRHFKRITLDETDYDKALDRVVESGLRGGAIHDALILQSAIKKKVPLVVTWNKKHFEKLSSGHVRVETPDSFIFPQS